MLARDQEMLAMRGQLQAGTGDRKQMREQMMAGRTKYEDQLKAVLTPDQFTKYTAMQANRREHGRGMALPKEGKVKAKDGKVKIKAKTDA
jgi:protein CpxP